MVVRGRGNSAVPYKCDERGHETGRKYEDGRWPNCGFRVKLFVDFKDDNPGNPGILNDKIVTAPQKTGKVVETELPKQIVNSIGMKFNLIPAGTLSIKSDSEPYWWTDWWMFDVRQQQKIAFDKSFYMGIYEVTQDQYEKIMKKNPSQFIGKNKPVESVTWYDAMEFCRRLTALGKKEEREYRLPTEAEWEYAYRAGTTTSYYFGNDVKEEVLDRYCWYWGNSEKETKEVGVKAPNAWGLYDMAGNVWEWCLDWYSIKQASNEQVSPKGPVSGYLRVLRGGSWRNFGYCRASDRGVGFPSFGNDYTGFRVVLVVHCKSKDEIANFISQEKKILVGVGPENPGATKTDGKPDETKTK
jgi:formylglycine-generating enzyme required for sulfatase activity